MTGTRVLSMAVLAGAVCAAAAGPALAVTPDLTCVAPRGGGWIGYFGYSNPDPAASVIGIGPGNRFRPGPRDIGQPVRFEPDTPPVPGFGDTRAQIVIGAPFSRGIRWELDGGLAAASPASPRCRFDLGVSITPDVVSARPGTLVNWRVELMNAGTSPVPRNQIVLTTVDLPPLAIARIPPDELMPGESMSYRGISRARASECGERIVAESAVRLGPGVVETPDADASNDQAIGAFDVVCETDLSLVATSAAAAYSPGQIASYTLTVTNAGDVSVPSDSVTIEDPTLRDITPAGIPPARLAPGESLRFTATRAITEDMCGTGATSRPRVGFSVSSLTDGNPADNEATVSVEVTGGACNAVPEPDPPVVTRDEGSPTPVTRLGIVAVGRTLGTVGGRGVYRFRIRNTGRHTARGVVLTAVPPPGAVILSRPVRSRVRAGRLIVRVRTLRPRAARVVSVRVRFTKASPRRRQAVGVVRATNAATARATVRVRVRPRPVRVRQQLPPVTG